MSKLSLVYFALSLFFYVYFSLLKRRRKLHGHVGLYNIGTISFGEWMETANWTALLMNLRLITAQLGRISPSARGCIRTRFYYWRCCIDVEYLWTSLVGQAIVGSTLGCYTTKWNHTFGGQQAELPIATSSNLRSFCAWLCQDENLARLLVLVVPFLYDSMCNHLALF